MNQISRSDIMADVPWPTSDHRMPVPDTSMLPGSDKAPTAAASLMKNAVQGAHKTLDRLADSAAPVVRKVGDGVVAAGATWIDTTDRLRETRDEWVGSARDLVRDSPLTAVAASMALGALLLHVLRSDR